MLVVSNHKAPGEFYVVTNCGLSISTDSSNLWTPWPKEYLLQNPWAIVLA